jgi:uncharacterized protein
LEWESLEKYTTALFNNFLIWDKEKNNWILFLIALKEREIRLEIWTWLDTYITDDISWNILDDYVVSYLKDDKWDEWIKNWYNAVYAKLATYYWLNSDIEVKEPVATEPKKIWFFEGLIIIILIPFFVIINFIFWRIKGWGSRWWWWSSRWWWASRGF